MICILFTVLFIGCGNNGITDNESITNTETKENTEFKNIDGTVLNAGVCEIKNDSDGVLTIISDDGDYETAKQLNTLFSQYGIKGTVVGVVKNVAPYEE